MTIILNVRGTNGSGKTTYVRNLLGPNFDVWPVGPNRISTNGRRVALGDYNKTTGGCDTYKTFDSVFSTLEKLTRSGHFDEIIFEGITISTVYDRFRDWDRYFTLLGNLYIWAFLETPLDVCIANVYTRNAGRKFKVEMLKRKYRSIQNCRAKARRDGCLVMGLPYVRM